MKTPNFTKYKEILQKEAEKYQLHYCGEMKSPVGDICHSWCGPKYDIGCAILSARDKISIMDDPTISLEEYFWYTTNYCSYIPEADVGTEEECGQITLVTTPRYH